MKNSSRTGAAGLANSRPAILAWSLALVVGAVFFVTGPHARGAIVSAAGTGTIFTTGPGGPGPSVGPAPIPSAPADLSLFTGAGPVSAMLSENWIFTKRGPFQMPIPRRATIPIARKM